MNLINKIKQNKKEFFEYISNIPLKKRFIIYLLALAFSLFFVSGPVAIIINLYLFVDYFNLVSILVALVFFMAYNLFCSLSYSMQKRELNLSYSVKYIIIENFVISFLISILIYLFLIFILKEMVIW